MSQPILAPLALLLASPGLAAGVVAGLASGLASGDLPSERSDILPVEDQIIASHDCLACHDPESSIRERLDPVAAPDLNGVSGRVDHTWLVDFLADPRGVRPGSTHPHQLAGLAAAAIGAHVLLTDLRTVEECSLRPNVQRNISTPAPPAPVRRSTTNTIHRDAGALSATDGLRDRPQLRLRAEVVVVVEPDKLPSPRKEVGSSPAVTPAARARTPSEPSAARTRSEPSAARDLRSNPAGQQLKKSYSFRSPFATQKKKQL